MNTKSFLIADDDEQFQHLLEDILVKIYSDDTVTVLHAATGTEAVSIFEDRTENKEFIDVVITDYAMPEATGSDVIDHVMKKNPTPVVVVSAVAEAWEHDFIQEGAIYFLPKPFDYATAKNVMDAATSLKIDHDDIKKASEAIERLKSLET